MNLTPLEADVIKMMLRGEDPVLQELRKQIDKLSVRSREYTGVGFWTAFNVPPETALSSRANFEVTDVVANIPELEHQASFVLFIRKGLLSSLDGSIVDKVWPDKISTYKLAYIDSKGVTDEERREPLVFEKVGGA